METLKALEHQYTWLITGVAGFIGSHLLAFLLKHNQRVIGLDNFVTGHQKNIDEVIAMHQQDGGDPTLFTFIQGDIRELETCVAATANVDFVLHQAALGSVPRSINDPVTTHDINVSGFLNILLASKNAGVKRFVYASSSSVYGDSPLLPKVETHQGNPLSPYAVSKMTNELYAKAFSNCYNLNTIGLRYFNVFGARQDPNSAYAAVIPLWIKALLENKPVFINGDGNTSRDFCYIANVVQANILAALTTNPAALNTVYNIAVGQQTSLNQLYHLLNDQVGQPGQQPTYRDFRAGDITHSLATINKAQTLLEYQPQFEVTQGLQSTVEWYQHCLRP